MKTGQTKVNKTKATQITTHSGFTTVWVKAMPENEHVIYVGDASVKHETGYPLMPGEELAIQTHPNQVYVISPETGQRVAWAV